MQAVDLDGLEEAYVNQQPRFPTLMNTGGSETNQARSNVSAQVHRVQMQEALEKLNGEYQAWRMAPGNFGKPIPAKYSKVAAKYIQGPSVSTGGYYGSKDFSLRKGSFDITKEFLPGISDIMDVRQAYEFGKKGSYGLAALSLISLIPGADFITKPLKFAGKYADEAAKLVKTSGVLPGKREILTVTKTGLRTDAFKVASAAVGDLGQDAIPLMGKSTSKYPDANKIMVGMQSADGTRGWRHDFDGEKGAHYNWFNNQTGEKGAVFFEGNADEVNYLKQQMTKSL